MALKFTILGSGSSGGVPRIGNNWGACDRENPKNRRRRCSALVQRLVGGKTTSVLIDSGPDVRAQLLDADISTLDGVLYTHDHADHTHGIDELRVLAFNRRKRVDVYFDEATERALRQRFGYCFASPEGSSYPPILEGHHIAPGREVTIAGPAGAVRAMPFSQQHGDITSLGFRFGPIAYSSDISGLDSKALDLLQGLDVWVLDALRDQPHPSHFTVDQALEWIERVAPKRAILTHLHVDLDYEALRRRLPEHVEPAYDGMALTFGE